MRSKRGGTLAVEEIVKLVIGIGVFIFILFILFALGKIVASNLKEEQAKNTLDNILFEIEKIDVGATKEFIVESPKSWVLMKVDNQLCFCEKISGISCSGGRVCVTSNSYVSSSCSLVGTPGVSGGVSCVYIDKVPYKIFLTKEYGGRVEIDSLVLNSDDLSSSKYKGSLVDLNKDENFRAFVVRYISTKLDSDKQILVDYLNGLDFIKSANSEKKYWRLQYDTREGQPQYIYQTDLGSASKYWVDHADLSGVFVGDIFYNLKMDIYQVSSVS